MFFFGGFGAAIKFFRGCGVGRSFAKQYVVYKDEMTFGAFSRKSV
jgi:hypothetical protein